MNSIVFLGYKHGLRDPRLYHREMRELKRAIPEISIHYCKFGNLFSFDDLSKENAKKITVSVSPEKLTLINFPRKLFRKMTRWFSGGVGIVKNFYQIKKLSPSLIQASDVRELPFAFFCKVFLKVPFIYDSHEDYYRQVLDYSRFRVVGAIKGLIVNAMELSLVRFSSSVFCTDEFLFDKYRKEIYGCVSVHLLRNFPPILSAPRVNFKEKNTLDLVYIGVVNKYRGIIESANFVEKFNEKNSEKGLKLTLSVFSSPNYIVNELGNRGKLSVMGWRDLDDLRCDLMAFDVGLCLWKDIPKFHRNLPLKNFDYMSCGLPIVTSNFGNLQKYAMDSGSSICIDPTSYEEFECAIVRLFDVKQRKSLSENGWSYVLHHASFSVESKQYVNVIGKMIGSRADSLENL